MNLEHASSRVLDGQLQKLKMKKKLSDDEMAYKKALEAEKKKRK